MWSVKDSGSTSNLGTYYPGNQFVNVIAIDPWVSGFPTTAWYQAIQSMAAADGKPTALAEVGALPTPSQLASQPKWTYFNDWASFITSSNTNAQIQATYFDAPVLHQGQIRLPGSTAAGPITGYQGLCLDDRASGTANHTRHAGSDLGLHRQRQPAVAPAVARQCRVMLGTSEM